MTSNNGHLLWSGIVDKAKAVAAHLLGPRLSGWGVCTLAEGEGRYNPIGYHVGTVWPFDTSFIAWGLVPTRPQRDHVGEGEGYPRTSRASRARACAREEVGAFAAGPRGKPGPHRDRLAEGGGHPVSRVRVRARGSGRRFATRRDPAGSAPHDGKEGGLASLVLLGYAAAFGLLPLRATCRPPRFSASASVTSSSLAPLRASANVMRTVAPFPSGISAPLMSDTRTVFLATLPPLVRSARDNKSSANQEGAGF